LKIIAHRGFWNQEIMPNSYASFVYAFENGYGIETDFRDFNGGLVVSHDPPTDNNFVAADDFFKLAAKYPTLPLAINIKADGLQILVKAFIEKYKLTNYFVFDMSIPDMYRYHTSGIIYYTRKSEYEINPCLQENASGIWLDSFESEWYDKQDVEALLKLNKKIAVVSAELHKRAYKSQWELIKTFSNNIGFQNLFLCTDFPNEAKQFFGL
jgi:hypothetical protein